MIIKAAKQCNVLKKVKNKKDQEIINLKVVHLMVNSSIETIINKIESYKENIIMKRFFED